MLTALAAIWLATAAPILQSKPMSYHDRLLEYCEGRAGEKCCRASVRSMREEQARLKTEEKECARGTHPMSLGCPASLVWCSYRSVEEVRGREVRGDKLQ